MPIGLRTLLYQWHLLSPLIVQKLYYTPRCTGLLPETAVHKRKQMMKDLASNVIRDEVTRRTGWFRPFCLSILVLILLITCVVGGTVVLLVRQVITLPPGLISALTGGPAPVTIHANTVLERIQSLSEVMTTRYNYSSLVNSQRDMPTILSGLYGDRLLMGAVWQINSGIDVKKSNITQDKVGALTIQLPAPQLLSCFLDEKASYVISRDTGIFARPAPNLDHEAQRFAVAQFRDLALNADIYSEVQGHAKIIISDFVTSLSTSGKQSISVLTAPPDPNAPLPDSC